MAGDCHALGSAGELECRRSRSGVAELIMNSGEEGRWRGGRRERERRKQTSTRWPPCEVHFNNATARDRVRASLDSGSPRRAAPLLMAIQAKRRVKNKVAKKLIKRSVHAACKEANCKEHRIYARLVGISGQATTGYQTQGNMTSNSRRTCHSE